MTLISSTRKFSSSTPRTCKRITADRLSELRQLEDVALVELCLERDEAAWREFVRRYEPALRGEARKVISKALRTIMHSDAMDDVMQDFYLRILERDMHKLRFWHQGNRKAEIMTWLTMIANGIAIDHARRAFDRMSGCTKAQDKRREADRDPNRGAMWIEIEDRNMRDPVKKRRNRKSRDDE